MAINPVLDLDVLAPPHQSVKLRSAMHPDAKLYELRYESELSMEDIARLATLTKQVRPIIETDELDVPAAKMLDTWLDEALDIVFFHKLEPAVLDSMGYEPKWKILQFFGQTCMDQSGSLQEAEATTTPMTEPKTKRKSTTAT